MKAIFSALCTAVVMVSCAPSTPQTRIQQNPDMFENLSEKHKSLVESGQIARGMNQDAVYLAWGRPSYTMVGSLKGKDSERWDYTAARPVYSTSFFGAYGSSWGRYGCRSYGYGFGPEIAYVPSRVASVWFLDRRVDSWERVR